MRLKGTEETNEVVLALTVSMLVMFMFVTSVKLVFDLGARISCIPDQVHLCYVAKLGRDLLLILLSQPPKCWDYEMCSRDVSILKANEFHVDS